jgi:hypothetical protein
MQFKVACALDYEAQFSSTLILNIHAQRTPSQTIVDEVFTLDPPLPFSEFSPVESASRFIRIETGPHKHLQVRYAATVDCDVQTYRASEVEVTPVATSRTRTGRSSPSATGFSTTSSTCAARPTR